MADTITRDEVWVLAALLGLTGGGIMLAALMASASKDGGAREQVPLKPGEEMGQIATPSLDGKTQGSIVLPSLQKVTIGPVTLPYKGPGRDTYTTFSVVQNIGGKEVTVMSSGVAGVHVGPATTLAAFNLVSPDQVQPDKTVGPFLIAYWYPGVFEIVGEERVFRNPICGARPVAGLADALVTIYEKERPEDADGFASPTCTGRKFVWRQRWPGIIRFV